jgi:hypothetical protein
LEWKGRLDLAGKMEAGGPKHMAYTDPREAGARRNAAREARFRQESQREADAHLASVDARVKAEMASRRLARDKAVATALRENSCALLLFACAVVAGLLLSGLLAAIRRAAT